MESPAVGRVRASGDYLLSRDNWRLGLSSLLAGGLGLAPFKNVFWSSGRNPGNPLYYDCMEVKNRFTIFALNVYLECSDLES
jgi:hypothetical protein